MSVYGRALKYFRLFKCGELMGSLSETISVLVFSKHFFAVIKFIVNHFIFMVFVKSKVLCSACRIKKSFPEHFAITKQHFDLFWLNSLY